jgi:hypothetical protein
MKVLMAETVRFSEIMRVGGQPRFYLALKDPRTDKAFKEAEREQRIVSLKQIPTGTKKDFGFVGVLNEQFVSYLIFPRPLADFSGKRVVGIKYDELENSETIKPSARRKEHTAHEAPPKIERPTKPAPKPKPAPEKKRFKARVQIMWTKTADVEVEAFTRTAAKALGKEIAREQAHLPNGRIMIRVFGVRQINRR